MYKIKRTDSPDCAFCSSGPETLLHLFCQCPKILPLWHKLFGLIDEKTKKTHLYSIFNMMFGVNIKQGFDSCINFVFLCLKFYIYRCRFQGSQVDFEVFLALVKCKQKIEYKIANKKGKLGSHLKKWSMFSGTNPL